MSARKDDPTTLAQAEGARAIGGVPANHVDLARVTPMISHEDPYHQVQNWYSEQLRCHIARVRATLIKLHLYNFNFNNPASVGVLARSLHPWHVACPTSHMAGPRWYRRDHVCHSRGKPCYLCRPMPARIGSQR